MGITLEDIAAAASEDVLAANPELAELVGKKRKRNKFGAQPTEIDGIRFDSGWEAQRYQELKVLERAGLIRDLETQPAYELQPAFQHRGKRVAAIRYTADFRYVRVSDGQEVIEDAKGVTTEAFSLRWRMLKRQKPDAECVIVRRPKRKGRK